MRELERPPDTSAAPVAAPVASLAIVGRGRLGSALSAALREPSASASSELRISEPLDRNPDLTGFDAVLLCVPDAAIGSAAAAVPPGPLVGHCSGASGLEPLTPHQAFSLHPLMTVPAGAGRERFIGAGAAVAGSTPAALDFARRLAERLQMQSFELAEEDRTAYHAAASIASNFLVTLEAAAERLAAGTGAGREMLVPLVRATVENWAELGPERALTGPIARGDAATVAAQRDAVAERTPELLAMFDSLVEVTRTLVFSPSAALA